MSYCLFNVFIADLFSCSWETLTFLNYGKLRCQNLMHPATAGCYLLQTHQIITGDIGGRGSCILTSPLSNLLLKMVTSSILRSTDEAV